MTAPPPARGILLAGGKGTRLYPMTAIVSKQLQPVYDKPMIYYPLTTLMVAGIRDILLISSPEDVPRFEALMGDGSQWGIKLSYAVQPEPKGIAQALIIGEDFIGDDTVVLMLGDNLLHGPLEFLRESIAKNGTGATIFGYQVRDPQAYGVVEFDSGFRVLSLEEKPARPRSNWAVPGIYVYGPGVSEMARSVKPSARGELEITELNRQYLETGRLKACPMGRGMAWLDTGTVESLLEAANYVHAVQHRQGLTIGSPDEAALRIGLLSAPGLERRLEDLPASPYRQYLQHLLDEHTSS